MPRASIRGGKMRQKKPSEEVSRIRREQALAHWAKLAPPPTANIRCVAYWADLVRVYSRSVGKRASEIVTAALRDYFAQVALLQPDLFAHCERVAGAAHSSGRASARAGASGACPGGRQSRKRADISRK